MKLVITIDTHDRTIERPYTLNIDLDGESLTDEAIISSTLEGALDAAKEHILNNPPSEAVILDLYRADHTFRSLVHTAVDSWAGSGPEVFHVDNEYLRGQVELIQGVAKLWANTDPEWVRDDLIGLIAMLVARDNAWIEKNS